MVTAGRATQTDGLTFLRGLLDGSLPPPPIATLLGMQPRSVERGSVRFALDVGEHLYNPIGSVHGGVFCTLLDTVMGCAVHSTLPAGRAYTTLELKVNLVRPLTVATAGVIAEGEVVTTGKRVATATGRIVDADGKLYAHATTTCLVFDVVSSAA